MIPLNLTGLALGELSNHITNSNGWMEETEPMAGESPETSFADAFKAELRNGDPRILIHKYIVAGDSRTLPSADYHQLRVEIADWFSIHPNEVIMVGSGKLGFSISPDKMFREFSRDSDYDIAILSSDLFDFYWRIVFRYGETHRFWQERDNFHRYLVKGWLRPDYLPSSDFNYKREWWDFFGSLSGKQVYGRRRINAGIYKSWDYLEAYQAHSLSQCKLKMGRR